MKKTGFFIFLVLLLGCTPAPVFEAQVNLQHNEWNRFNFLIFEVPVVQDQLLDFELNVKFTEQFTSDKITTNITFYPPDGSLLSGDYTFTLSKENEDPKTTGLHLFRIRKQMRYSKTGTCEVRIENKSSKIKTPGISSIELIARRSK